MDFKFVSEGDVVVGRDEKKTRRYGTRGTGFLGRVVMSKGTTPVLGRRVLVDLASSHVMLVLGKRGYGKSYTLGVLVEELASLPFSVRARTAVVVIDTMGIFWTLKYPNTRQKDVLERWGLEPKRFDVDVLVPKQTLQFYLESGVPVDGHFGINTADMGPEEWLSLLSLSSSDPEGALLVSVLEELEGEYTVDDLAEAVARADADVNVKRSLFTKLHAVAEWNLFGPEFPRITEYAAPGKVNILDVSTLRHTVFGGGLRDVVVALLGKKLLEERIKYRKREEVAEMRGADVESMPLVWMIIDEAHLFMSTDQETLSSRVLSEWIRIGRQPGLSLVLATQRVDKLHEDAITQADIILAHRITSLLDVKALSRVRPTYVTEGLDKQVSALPHTKGMAVLLDDVTEKMWVIMVRPRMSWHGGESASALPR